MSSDGLKPGRFVSCGRFLTVVEELIEWALEGTRQLFQRFDGRDCIAISNAGNITTQQPCSRFLDVALGEFLFFAQCAVVRSIIMAALFHVDKDARQVQIWRPLE